MTTRARHDLLDLILAALAWCAALTFFAFPAHATPLPGDLRAPGAGQQAPEGRAQRGAAERSSGSDPGRMEIRA